MIKYQQFFGENVATILFVAFRPNGRWMKSTPGVNVMIAKTFSPKKWRKKRRF
jgi:hypothetical protein